MTICTRNYCSDDMKTFYKELSELQNRLLTSHTFCLNKTFGWVLYLDITIPLLAWPDLESFCCEVRWCKFTYESNLIPDKISHLHILSSFSAFKYWDIKQCQIVFNQVTRYYGILVLQYFQRLTRISLLYCWIFSFENIIVEQIMKSWKKTRRRY